MTKSSRILIVEDEPSINQLLNMVLASDGFTNIRSCFNGLDALKIIEQWLPDIVLLDVMLPGIDGVSLCRQVKANPRIAHVKVIMLTAKKMEEDILDGFESGAIDYITKPFSNKVLLARIKAQLGTSAQMSATEKVLVYKDFSMNLDTQVARLCGEEVNLTFSEFEIMKLFVQNVGRVYSRSKLLSVLRGDDGFDVAERAIDVQIVNLRKKLGEFGVNIRTVRGVGYKLNEDS